MRILTRKPRWARQLSVCVLGTAIVCGCLSAQAPTAGEQTRTDSGQQSYNSPGATYTGSVSTLAKPVKSKAIVKAVDLERRQVTVVPLKTGETFRTAEMGPSNSKRIWGKAEKLELVWMTPAGTETIRTTKKAAKMLGKKVVPLQELKAGSRVKIEYYPVSGEVGKAPGNAWVVVNLTVEDPA